MLEALEADDRLIRAYDVLRKIEAHLASPSPDSGSNSNTDRARALMAAPERAAKTEILRTRATEVLATLADLEDVRSFLVGDDSAFIFSYGTCVVCVLNPLPYQCVRRNPHGASTILCLAWTPITAKSPRTPKGRAAGSMSWSTPSWTAGSTWA